jgi:hypothetical protein
MAHVRKQIRDRIASVLSSNVSLVKRRVYASRVYPLTEDNLPAITVYTGSEVSNRLNMGLKDLNRSLSIDVDLYVRVTKTFDDDVDKIAVQVEEAIANDFTVNGLAKEAVLTGTDIQFSGDAEQPVGVAKLTFTVRYVTALTDVEAAR